MIRKHTPILGITVALILLFIAASKYPGGSQADLNSIGFDIRNNYFSNLFNPLAMNGAENTSRPWAIAGMFFMSISMGLFFYKISTKIASGNPARMIKYFGLGSMIFTFFIVTSYHDIMTTLSTTCGLVSLFYITVFIFRSRLMYFKILSVVSLILFYVTNYIYYSGQLISILPIMQKVSFLFLIIWVLGLEYFTKKEDFQIESKPVLKEK